MLHKWKTPEQQQEDVHSLQFVCCFIPAWLQSPWNFQMHSFELSEVFHTANLQFFCQWKHNIAISTIRLLTSRSRRSSFTLSPGLSWLSRWSARSPGSWLSSRTPQAAFTLGSWFSPFTCLAARACWTRGSNLSPLTSRAWGSSRSLQNRIFNVT